MSNEGIAVQISEQEVTKEAVLEFMRGALAPVDVRDGLNRIAEFVEESVGNVKSSLAEAKRKPKEALLATIGVMAIAAGMASTRLGGATQAELAIELNRSFDNALVEQAIPIPFPGEFPAAPTLPRTVPRTIPGEQDIPYTGGRADSLPYADAVPIDRVDILPYADAIPFERDVSAQPPAPDRLVDYVVPAALPEPGTPEIIEYGPASNSLR